MKQETQAYFFREVVSTCVSLFWVFVAWNFVCSPQLVLAEEKGAKEVLRVGAIVPLSGPLAFFGNDYVRTLELYREDHPDLKDQIEVVFEDSAYDGKQAISAYRKLVDVEKVNVIFSFGGPMLNVLAPLAEADKIPFFATESAKEDCENRVFCSLFRNEEDEWGKATWQMLRKHGKSNIGIIKNQNQFMNTFVSAIERTKAESEQVRILADLAPSTMDLRSELLVLRKTKVDALGLYLLPDSHRGAVRSLGDLHLNVLYFGVEELLHPENNKGYEQVTSGSLVIAPAVEESYRKRFESKYGFSAGFFYTPALYDFLSLLQDTVKNRSKTTGGELLGKALVDALRFSGTRKGVSGPYSVKKSPKGVYSFSFPISVYKIEGGVISVEDTFQF